MSTFQIIVSTIFFIFIVVSVLMFGGVIPGFRGSSGGSGGEVVVWGTMSKEDTRSLFDGINQEHDDAFSVTYVRKNPESYETDLVQALAAGEGPDIFFLPHELILKHKDKVQPISYETVTRRQFQNTFLEQGELFFTDEGILAFPFIVDPLVMYWNRDLFSQKSIAEPPAYWDELFTMVPKLTEADDAGNVTQSGVALGTFSNIQNAKPILSTLILQTGNPIVEKTDEEGARAVLGNQEQRSKGVSAVRFYTQFADPANELYTWNPGLEEARSRFTAESLAVYFGFASELGQITTQNPHINVDAAPIPQVRDAKSTKTFGRLTGLAISKQTEKPQTAFQVLNVLTQPETLTELSKILRLPPVRRGMLSQDPTDAYNAVFYDAAIASSGWLDPNPEKTYTIFSDMINGVISGRSRINEALSDAQAQLEVLFR